MCEKTKKVNLPVLDFDIRSSISVCIFLCKEPKKEPQWDGFDSVVWGSTLSQICLPSIQYCTELKSVTSYPREEWTLQLQWDINEIWFFSRLKQIIHTAPAYNYLYYHMPIYLYINTQTHSVCVCICICINRVYNAYINTCTYHR